MIKVIARIIGLQVIATILVALLLWLLLDRQAAYSAFVGGTIGFVPGAVYAIRILRVGNASPERIWRAHAVGEASKFALTLLLFAAAFAYLRDISALPLFFTYMVTLAVYWGALFFA